MAKVSVIILNWNGASCIEECVDGLLGQSFRDFEIVIADNGSTDGSLELVKTQYAGRVLVVENGRNEGYARGNNLAIEKATGEWIALLNNDAVPDKFWLEKAMETVEKEEKRGRVGMAASKILSYDRRDILDNTGHLIYPDGLNRGRGRLERDAGQFDNCREALFPSGCAGLYRREMLDETGLLDEDFFAYGEDADLGLRGRICGWKCVYAPDAVVYHRYSLSAGAYSKLKAYHVERNRVWVMLKNFPTRMICVSPFYSLLRYSLQAYGAISGKGAAGVYTKSQGGLSLIGVLLKALFDAAKGAPKMLKKRRDIWRKARISQSEMARLIKEHRIGLKELALKD